MSRLQISNLDYFQPVSDDSSVKGGLLISGISPLDVFASGLLLPNEPTQLTSIGSSSISQSISTDPGVPTVAVSSASLTSQGLIGSLSLFAAVS